MNPKVKETSLKAYQELVNSGRLRKDQLKVIEFFVKMYEAYGTLKRQGVIKNKAQPNGATNFTYREIRIFCGDSSQKRLSEIERMGIIEKVGKRNRCFTYQYVPDPERQAELRQNFIDERTELERFTAWFHTIRPKPLGVDWYCYIDSKYSVYSHKQLVKVFKNQELKP